MSSKGNRLSKSKISAFEHCPRRLWLQVHRREVGKFDGGTQALFAAGHRVGEIARERVPGGVLIDDDPRHIDAAIARTRFLFESGWNAPIFEAAFRREDVVFRADIMAPDGWGGWALTEVKNSVRVRDSHLRDLGTQAWVLAGANLCISSFSVRHVARRYAGGKAEDVTFVDVPVTDEIRPVVRGRGRVIAEARKVMNGPEPARPMGAHCTRPFACEFQSHCAQQQLRAAPSHQGGHRGCSARE